MSDVLKISGDIQYNELAMLADLHKKGVHFRGNVFYWCICLGLQTAEDLNNSKLGNLRIV